MTGEIPCCFAIVADDQDEPTAAFEHLEDALDWAVRHYGSNSFRIRHLRLVVAEGAPVHEDAPQEN
jgi:hypothetical protein